MITNKTIRDFVISKKLFKGSEVITDVTIKDDIVTFESNNTLPLKECTCFINPIQEGTGDPSPSNPRPIIGYDKIVVSKEVGQVARTYTVNLGQTVYGGSADVVGGAGDEIFGSCELGDLTWNKASGYYYSTSLRGIVKSEGIGLCETLKNAQSGDNTFRFTNNGDIILISAIYNAMTKEEFIEDVSNVKLIYELATPTDFTFTPKEIRTSEGENTFYHDGNGEIEVTYQSVAGQGDSAMQYLPLFYGKKQYRKET